MYVTSSSGAHLCDPIAHAVLHSLRMSLSWKVSHCLHPAWYTRRASGVFGRHMAQLKAWLAHLPVTEPSERPVTATTPPNTAGLNLGTRAPQFLTSVCHHRALVAHLTCHLLLILSLWCPDLEASFLPRKMRLPSP